jgi:hypothetical protein
MKNRLHHRDTEITEEKPMMCSAADHLHRASRAEESVLPAVLCGLGVSVVNTTPFEARTAAAQPETGTTPSARLPLRLCASVVRTTP